MEPNRGLHVGSRHRGLDVETRHRGLDVEGDLHVGTRKTGRVGRPGARSSAASVSSQDDDGA